MEGFTSDNSNVREKDGIITITYRGEAEVPIDGELTWAPFTNFKLEF